MTDLSPESLAVLEAVHLAMAHQQASLSGVPDYRQVTAAALHAAADQVVPEYEMTPGGSKIWQSEPAPSIRAALHAIAAELEDVR